MNGEIRTWWIIRGHDREGPFARDELKAMIGQGSLQGEDKIWKDGLAAPVYVSAVQGLLPVEGILTQEAAGTATFTPSSRQEDISKPLTLDRPIAQPYQTLLALALMAGVMLFVALVLFGETALQGGARSATFIFSHVFAPIIGSVTLLMMFLIVMGRIDQARKARLRNIFADANGFEFTCKVTPNFGAAMLRGAILIRGHTDWPRLNLLRGLRRGHYFQAIDYFFGQGRGGFTQTVIVIRLRQDSPINFAIIQDFLEHAGRRINMVRVKSQPAGLAKDQILVSREGSSYINLPSGFIHAAAHMDGANIEVLKDRLLVYKLHEVFTNEDYTRWIDFAMTLEELLAHQPPNTTEAGASPTDPPKELSRRTLMTIGLIVISFVSLGILWLTYKFAHTHLKIVVGLIIAATVWNAAKHLHLVHKKQEEHLDFFVSLSLGFLPVVLIAGIATWLFTLG